VCRLRRGGPVVLVLELFECIFVHFVLYRCVYVCVTHNIIYIYIYIYIDIDIDMAS
jgi:hypothetical protein